MEDGSDGLHEVVSTAIAGLDEQIANLERMQGEARALFGQTFEAREMYKRITRYLRKVKRIRQALHRGGV